MLLPPTITANGATAYAAGQSSLIYQTAVIVDQISKDYNGEKWPYTVPKTGKYFVDVATMADSYDHKVTISVIGPYGTILSLGDLSSGTWYASGASGWISLTEGQTLTIQTNHKAGNDGYYEQYVHVVASYVYA